MADFTRVISWNAQGGALGKLGNIQSLFSSSHEHILLIQELGNPDDFTVIDDAAHSIGHKKFRYTARPQKDAENKRCSVGLFFETNDSQVRNIQVEEIPGIKRPFIYMDTIIDGKGHKLLIATMHATSGNPVKAKYEIERVAEYLSKKAGNPMWILMGDFNLDASKTENMDFLKSMGIQIKTTGTSTQRSGGILDYALFSPNYYALKDTAIGQDSSYRDSDHTAIWLDLPFHLRKS